MLFDGAGPGRNAYVVQDEGGVIAVSIPGDPGRAARLTTEAIRAYPGPSSGEPAAWVAGYAAARLGAWGVELAEAEGDEEEY